jgi:beta-lactamase superfamily II metal-dependent hydrolase
MNILRSGGLALALLALCSPVWSTPPDYKTYARAQQIDYGPQEDEVLRIWVIYVDQGDGILIQLPSKYVHDSEERIDIMIDGGANPTSNAWRLADFLERIYGEDLPVIEHSIISHHDQDHVAGLIHLLNETDASFEAVYHNGLASYRPGCREFPVDKPDDFRAVFKDRKRKIKKGMALIDPDSGDLTSRHIIDDLQELRQAFENEELQGIYEDLAEAILARDEITAFQRAHVGAPFVVEREAARGVQMPDLKFEVIWPLSRLKPYGGKNWGETINGNSVTFRLVYRDFEMLFPGDHNEKSQEALLEHLGADKSAIDCDVLKVPHHGSAHAYEPFFDRGKRRPVVSVASMGNQGFKSKAMYSGNWQHPSTDVIRWLGGAHRVYHTFIHERRFRWNEIDTDAKRRQMIERSHILIETDGRWFRVVEIPVDGGDPRHPPDVRDTRRGNGTRWIRAGEEE